MFLWQFFIPLVIFVVAYWKILGVIRRQAKLMATKYTGAEPVAGTSSGTNNIGMTSDRIDAGKRVSDRLATVKRSGGQSRSENQNKGLSRAKINVIKTMMYIVICFILCWMPKNFYLMFMKLMVRQIKCFDYHLFVVSYL